MFRIIGLFYFNFVFYPSSFSGVGSAGTVFVDVFSASLFIFLSCVVLVSSLFVLTVCAGMQICAMLGDVPVRPTVAPTFVTLGALSLFDVGERSVDGGGDYRKEVGLAEG